MAQNKGLRAWLTAELARAQGCAASLRLDAPLTFATGLARALVPGAASPDGRHPFDAGPLAWRLAPVLEALPDEPVYRPLRAYLDGTGGQAMPLATRLAQLFDDYQVYRPDVLAAWAGGADPAPDFAHGAWQAALWRRLQTDAPCLDRAAGMLALAETLRRSAVRPDALPRRVSVFGALLFPPAYWRVLAGVARHVPVTVYAVTAGGAGPGPRRHPFLRALAGRTSDYWTVLAELGAAPPERLAAPAGGPPAGASALRQLQDALATDTPPPAPVPLDPADRSVRVLDCHSPTRELEALRDELLDAFDTVDGLRPADVLVMVPDLAEYAPLVDAVFGAESATGDGLRLPYHVVDHPHAPALRVVEAFTRALRLHDGRVTASDLLDLLGAPVVRRAARIDEDELPRLRRWVAEAGVRWGLDAERRGRFGVPADDLHTWRFGLDRLLLGVLCDADDLVLGHLPCDAAGLDGADLLGRFSEWAEALFRSLDALDRPRPLAEWPAHLLLFLDRAFDAREDEEVEALVHLRQTALDLAALSELTAAGAPDAPVSFRTVRAHLDGAVATMERREPVLTGRITVADPQTLRHAPHRVVALLGLGDGVWPRPETPLGFDLVAHAPRPGDAAPRAFQKQLAVDAVLAARDRLVLGHVGRSQKDNSPRARSVVLDAFWDAARAHWGADADRLAQPHRLQPFADDYFAGGPAWSFAAQHHVSPGEGRAAVPFLAGPLPEDDPATEVTLDDLAEAWTNPSRHVVRRRLRVALDLDNDAVRDDEPVALDALGRYAVRAAVLEGVLDGLADDAIAGRLLRSGLLPGGAPGPAWLRQAREAVAPVADAVRQWGPREPLAVAVDVDGGRVVGTVAHTGPAGALRFRPGGVRPRDLVAAWVDHLAVSAGRPATTTVLGTRDGAHFGPVPADDARMLLQALVRGYRTIRTSAPPLFEKASFAYADKLSGADRAAWLDRILARERAAAGLGDGSDHRGVPAVNDYALRRAREGFRGRFGMTNDGDRDDPHVALATRGRDPFADEAKAVHAWAACLWAPLRCYHQPGPPS